VVVTEKSFRWIGLTRIFHELLSRDREDGRATGSTIAECKLRNAVLKFAEEYVRTREQMVKSELLSSISSIVLKNPRSEIPNPRSKPRHT